MKKTNLLPILLLAMLIFSCSSDDDNIVIDEPADVPVVVADISVVINEVEYLGDRVEILNTGTTEANISDYFLCLGPGTYRNVGTLAGGSAIIAPGEFLVVTYNQLNVTAGQIEGVSGTGGLGLYIDNSNFADPETLSDFVQWGAAGSIRETTAVAAGIWTAGEFVSVSNVENTSIIYDGEGDLAADFAETAVPSFGAENGDPVAQAPLIRSIVLNEVEYLGDRVEIFNNGEVSADVSDYFLCLGPGTYRNVGALAGGSAIIAPGEFLVVTYNQLNVTVGQIDGVSGTGGLGLYIDNSNFADPETLSDFVQWGAAGSIRENTAVAAGIWTVGEFVSVVNVEETSIIFDGEGDEATDFAETTVPSFGAENGAPVAPIRSIVLNEVEYLGDRVEILNNGNVSADISGYFLCLGPGTYRNVGTLAGGSAIIAPGEFLVVTYDQLNVTAGQISGVNGTGGLGLYINNTNFGNSETLSDFVQWGAAGSIRENTAVAAGIWTAGEFVPVVNAEETSIIFDGEGDAAADFAETTTPSFGEENGDAVPPAGAEPNESIVINEVEFRGDDRVELFNNGNVTVDLSGYFLCLAPGTYRQIGNLPVNSGNTTLAPGEFLVVTYDQINMVNGQINAQEGTGGLGLYINNSGFGSAANIMDFVQWGAQGSVRENVGNASEEWTTGDFITVSGSTTNSLSFDGEGATSSDWTEGANTLGAANN